MDYAVDPPHPSRTDDGRRYEKCSRCNMVQIGKPWLPDHATEERRYRLHNNDADNLDYLAYQRSKMKELVLPVVKKGSSVLDMGCGPSPVLAHLLRDRDFRADYYDPFFYPDRSVFNGTYDAVLAIEVIEHLHDPKTFFSIVHGLLKDRGLFIFGTGLWRGDETEFRQWWYRQDSTHVTFYTPETVSFIADRWFSGYSLLDDSGWFQK